MASILPSRVNFDAGQGLFLSFSKMVDNVQEPRKIAGQAQKRSIHGSMGAF
jgi:hypothetical protein